MEQETIPHQFNSKEQENAYQFLIQMNAPIRKYKLWHKEYLGSMKAAVLLYHLEIWAERYCEAKFYRTNKLLMENIGLSKMELRGAKKILVNKASFLKITHEREGKERFKKTFFQWDLVAYKKVAEDFIMKNRTETEEAPHGLKQPVCVLWPHGLKQPANKYNNKRIINVRAKSARTDSETKIPNFERYIKYATQLSQIVQKHKNIKTNPSSWAKWFCKIKDTNGKIPVPRIKAALDWYAIHAYEPYVPVIESGESFHRKFIQLENAMKRNDNQQQFQGYSQPNQISEERKEVLMKRYGKIIPKYKELGIDTTNIIDLFQGLKCWWEGTKDFWLKCKADYIEYQKPLPDGTVMGGGRVGHRSHIACAVMEEQIFSELYLYWVMDELQEWKNWNGSFNQYLPGGKGWKKFCHQLVRHREWRLDAELRKVIQCEER